MTIRPDLLSLIRSADGLTLDELTTELGHQIRLGLIDEPSLAERCAIPETLAEMEREGLVTEGPRGWSYVPQVATAPKELQGSLFV